MCASSPPYVCVFTGAASTDYGDDDEDDEEYSNPVAGVGAGVRARNSLSPSARSGTASPREWRLVRGTAFPPAAKRPAN